MSRGRPPAQSKRFECLHASSSLCPCMAVCGVWRSLLPCPPYPCAPAPAPHRWQLNVDAPGCRLLHHLRQLLQLKHVPLTAQPQGT